MTQGEHLLKELMNSGLISAADLRAVSENAVGPACPTHQEFLPDVLAVCPAATVRTYRAGFNRLVDAFTDLALSDVRTGDLDQLSTAVQADVAARLGTTGAGAAHNLTDAARFFYRHAVALDLIRSSPATAMRTPLRNTSARRALEGWEMGAIADTVTMYSRDPELDLLLLTFHRETAARQGGALRLRLSDLRLDRPSVLLTEKGNKEREVPASRDLLLRMIRLAQDRGAVLPGDHVFRSSQRRPITRRKYNSLFAPARRHLAWAERLGVSIHWYRHTTLTDIARATNSRIAAAYAGHAPQSVTDVYTHVDFMDLAEAHAQVFPTVRPP